MLIEDLDIESIVASIGSGAITTMIGRFLLGRALKDLDEAVHSIHELERKHAVLETRVRLLEKVVRIEPHVSFAYVSNLSSYLDTN